jgi:hypothetical protein
MSGAVLDVNLEAIAKIEANDLEDRRCDAHAIEIERRCAVEQRRDARCLRSVDRHDVRTGNRPRLQSFRGAWGDTAVASIQPTNVGFQNGGHAVGFAAAIAVLIPTRYSSPVRTRCSNT